MVGLMGGVGDRDQRKPGFEVVGIPPSSLVICRKGRLTAAKIFCTEFLETHSLFWTMTPSLGKFNYGVSRHGFL